MSIKDKLSSRKFWLSAAAFLGSIAATVGGLTIENETVAVIGVICGTLSAAIYAGCEAYIDAAAINIGEATETSTNVIGFTVENSESEGD